MCRSCQWQLPEKQKALGGGESPRAIEKVSHYGKPHNVILFNIRKYDMSIGRILIFVGKYPKRIMSNPEKLVPTNKKAPENQPLALRGYHKEALKEQKHYSKKKATKQQDPTHITVIAKRIKSVIISTFV